VAIKKPVRDRLLVESGANPRSVAQAADVLTETAFVSGSLVFVNQTLANRFVDYGHRFLIGGLRRFLVTTGYRLHDIFNVSAQPRVLADIALAADFRLTGAFTRLGRICQNFSPVPGSNEPSTMQFTACFVNYPASGVVR
jgi:hypothetical protein